MAMVASMKSHNVPAKLDGASNDNKKDELDTLLENLVNAPSSSKGSTSKGSIRPEPLKVPASSSPQAKALASPQPPSKPASFAAQMATRRASKIKAEDVNESGNSTASDNAIQSPTATVQSTPTNTSSGSEAISSPSGAGPQEVSVDVHAVPKVDAGGLTMFNIMAGAASLVPGEGSDSDEDDEKFQPPAARAAATTTTAGGGLNSSRSSSLASNPLTIVRPAAGMASREVSVHRGTISLTDISSSDSDDTDDEEQETFVSKLSASLPISAIGKFFNGDKSGRGGGIADKSGRGFDKSGRGADKSGRGGDPSVNRRMSVTHATDAELAVIAQDRSMHGGPDRSVRRCSSRRPTDMDGSFDFEIPTLSKVSQSMASNITGASGRLQRNSSNAAHLTANVDRSSKPPLSKLERDSSLRYGGAGGAPNASTSRPIAGRASASAAISSARPQTLLPSIVPEKKKKGFFASLFG